MNRKMKIIAMLVLPLSLLVVGCDTPEDLGQVDKQAYDKFTTKYGSTDVYVCEKGIMYNKYIYITGNSLHMRNKLMVNDIGNPIRCGDAEIKVIETSQGTDRW
jgi:hypothetical protein